MVSETREETNINDEHKPTYVRENSENGSYLSTCPVTTIIDGRIMNKFHTTISCKKMWCTLTCNARFNLSSWPHFISREALMFKKSSWYVDTLHQGNRLADGSGRCHWSWQPRVAGERRGNGQNLRNSTSVYTSELLSLLLLTALGVASLWSGSKHGPYSLMKYLVAQPACRFFTHCIRQTRINRL